MNPLRSAFLSVLLCACAAVRQDALAEPVSQTAILPPGTPAVLPSAPHRLTYRRLDGGGQFAGEQFSDTTWFRVTRRSVDGSRDDTFVNLVTGTSFQLRTDEDGRYRELYVQRWFRGDANDVKHTRTKRRDRVLGEVCFVWRTELAKPVAHVTSSFDCITADGIRLWAGAYRRPRKITKFWIATSLERRPVGASEVQPPAGILDWSRWRETSAPTTQLGRDYDVRLSGLEATRVARRHGGILFTDSTYTKGIRVLEIGAPSLTLRYEARKTSQSLWIARETVSVALPKMLENRAERFGGETCNWFGSPEVDNADAMCLTADGAPLRVVRRSGARATVDLTATTVSREPLDDGAVIPPAEVFVWQ